MFDDSDPDGDTTAAVASGDAGANAPGLGAAGRLRSGPSGPRGPRLAGAVLAVAGVALLVIGLVTLRGRPPSGGRHPPGAITTTTASAPATASTGPTATAAPSTVPTSGGSASPSGRTPPPTVPPPSPAPVPHVPLTVLNNSLQPRLAESAAAQFTAAGWQVALIGNFAGRIPTTTVYYTSGDQTQLRSADGLAAEFPGIHRVMPRYAGLPPTPPGLVVVLTNDWTG